MMTMKGTEMKVMLKIIVAGATIFAIGLGMVVLQPEVDEPVSTADADIAAFTFGPKSQQQMFIDTLKQEGMEEPRAYDHNGNKMFFSTTTTTETPRQVLERFQRGFVENGLNRTVHLRPWGELEMDKFIQAQKTSDTVELKRQATQNETRMLQMNDFVGGMMPVMVDDSRVIMTGATTENRADDWMDYFKELTTKRAETPRGERHDPSKAIDAMRYLEAFREGSKTRIIAVWSDEDYEAGKLADIGEDLNVNPDLPSCPGCKRLYNIEGETESDYSTAAYSASGHSVDQVVSFYDRVLVSKGWRLSPTAHVLDAAESAGMKRRTEGTLLQYNRGAEFLTLVAWPGDNGATVHLAQSN